MPRRVLVMTIILVVIVIGTVYWWKPWASSSESGKPVGTQIDTNNSQIEADKSKPPGYEFKLLNLVGMHKGKRQWELRAKSVNTNDETKTAAVEDLRRVAVYRDGKIYFTGSAKRGIFKLDTNDVEVTGDIKLSTSDGDSFATDRIIWTAASEMLEIPGQVDMVLDGRHIRADRAFTNIKTEQVTITGNIIIEGQDERMTGETLIYNIKDKSMQFIGGTSIELEMP